MTVLRPPLIGGPLDSLTLSPGSRPNHVWCIPASNRDRELRARAFTRPMPGRHLYVVESSGGAYLYGGDRLFRCTCGGYNDRALVACQICGYPRTAMR